MRYKIWKSLLLDQLDLSEKPLCIFLLNIMILSHFEGKNLHFMKVFLMNLGISQKFWKRNFHVISLSMLHLMSDMRKLPQKWYKIMFIQARISFRLSRSHDVNILSIFRAHLCIWEFMVASEKMSLSIRKIWRIPMHYRNTSQNNIFSKIFLGIFDIRLFVHEQFMGKGILRFCQK